MQEYLATAEERLRSAKLEAALAEHQAEVEAVVSQMREGGASEHDITMYEAEQAVEEAAEVKEPGFAPAYARFVVKRTCCAFWLSDLSLTRSRYFSALSAS